MEALPEVYNAATGCLVRLVTHFESLELINISHPFNNCLNATGGGGKTTCMSLYRDRALDSLLMRSFPLSFSARLRRI